MIQALRNKVAAKLEERLPAPEYVDLREGIRLIAPDPAWLLAYKSVPHEVVATHVGAWLAEIGAPPLGENPGELSPLQAVREANRATVASFAKAAAPLVRTWCDQRNRKRQRCGPTKTCRTLVCATSLKPMGAWISGNLIMPICSVGVLHSGFGPGMEETLIEQAEYQDYGHRGSECEGARRGREA